MRFLSFALLGLSVTASNIIPPPPNPHQPNVDSNVVQQAVNEPVAALSEPQKDPRDDRRELRSLIQELIHEKDAIVRTVTNNEKGVISFTGSKDKKVTTLIQNVYEIIEARAENPPQWKKRRPHRRGRRDGRFRHPREDDQEDDHHGPREDNNRRGPREDDDRRGPREDDDRRGPREDDDRRGPREDNDREDNDRRGPREDNDRRGPREDNDRRGPQGEFRNFIGLFHKLKADGLIKIDTQFPTTVKDNTVDPIVGVQVTEIGNDPCSIALVQKHAEFLSNVFEYGWREAKQAIRIPSQCEKAKEIEQTD